MPAAPPPITTTSTSLMGIVHPHKIKPMWRRDLTARRAVAGGQRGCEIAGAPFAFADMNQRADNRTHLMLQEGACRGGDAHIIAVACDVKTIERLYRRLRLALGRTKRRKIVLADKFLRSIVHVFFVKRPRHAPRVNL